MTCRPGAVMTCRPGAVMTCRPGAAAPEAALAAQLLGDRRCNVTFVVDRSEGPGPGLGPGLEPVKRLLVQTLLRKASLRDSLFNIVTFSSQPTCWSPHMLPCAPDTVYMSLSWIHSIRCSRGRDLLSALGLALSDPDCHAVHLLVSGPPDQPSAVLAALPALAAGRPVHVFYLQDSAGQQDRDALDYLQGLSQATGGRCHLVPVGVNGVLQKIFPLSAVENQSSVSPVKSCCPSSFIPTSSSSSLRCILGNPCVLSGPEFFPGCRVLARREADGFYYLGTVTQQVQGRGGLWVVDLDPPPGFPGPRQLVCSLDMLNLGRTQTRRLVPGDAVLSPWQPERRRYGPGRVMEAHRDGAGGVGSVRVLMWNSCVSLVPVSLVLPISAPHHDRIVQEIQNQNQNQTVGGCCSWQCGGSSSWSPQPLCSSWSCFSCPTSSGCCSNLQPLLPPSCRSGCRSSFVGTDGFNRTEQDKQLDLNDADVRRSDPELPPSSSSSSSSSSSLSEDGSRVKLSRNQQRPPWRYWRRTGPEPQHRQPGSAAPRRWSHPGSFSLPSPPPGASPNHSSLFLSLPAATGRRANVRDVFGTSGFKPRPPAGLRPFSHNTNPVYT